MAKRDFLDASPVIRDFKLNHHGVRGAGEIAWAVNAERSTLLDGRVGEGAVEKALVARLLEVRDQLGFEVF